MFNGPGAKKYDFSHLNPLIVGAFILLICYLGSKNTFYDQFFKVSQLPENRNELSIIENIIPSISGNKVLFNISLHYTFKITYENFRNSFIIKIKHNGFTSVHRHYNMFDYQIDSNRFLSGFALSSIFGDVNISYNYLDEEIAQVKTNIPGIQLLFPGNTLVSKKADHYHFSNVFINKKNELNVYFQTEIVCDSNWIQFENGRTLPLVQLKKTPSEQCSMEGQCVSYDRTTHLFSIPLNSTVHNVFLSLFNPISEFSNQGQDKIVILSAPDLNEKMYQLILEMIPLFGTNIELLNSKNPNFFKELRIRNKISHNFKKLTQKIVKNGDLQDRFVDNELVIVTDEDTKNLISKEKAKEISSLICSSINGGCNVEFIEFASNENVVSKISKAHFLILPKKKAHFIFPLKNNAKAFLISDQQTDNDNNDDKWINDMAKDLSINVSFVKYENGNFDTSVFK